MERTVLLLALATGCSMDADEFERHSRRVVCEWGAECFEGHESAAACEQAIGSQPALETCTFDASMAPACVAALRQLTCDDPADTVAVECSGVMVCPATGDQVQYASLIAVRGGISEHQFYERYGQGMCTYLVDCFPGVFYASVEACIADASGPEDMDPQCSYDPVAAEICANAAGYIPCSAGEGYLPEECGEVYACPN